MNITQKIGTAVAIGGSVGDAIVGIKILYDASQSRFWGTLNPWHVLFFIFTAMLFASGVIFYLAWLDNRFASLGERIDDVISERDRSGTARESRFSTVEGGIREIERRLLKHGIGQ